MSTPRLEPPQIGVSQWLALAALIVLAAVVLVICGVSVLGASGEAISAG